MGSSFDQPLFTTQIDASGATRFLEIIRHLGRGIRFYQASTSELYGDCTMSPQDENTVMLPNSPYAIAKLHSFHSTRVYRQAYGLFACNGILFNHETVASFTPMFCKRFNETEFDIKPMREIVEFDESKKHYQSKPVTGIQVWGKCGWVDVTHASAYPHDVNKDNKQPRFINSRSGAFMATSSHIVFLDGDEEKKVGDLKLGDRLGIIKLPDPLLSTHHSVSKEEAELMGMIVGDGSITYEKRKNSLHGKFTNSSEEIRTRFASLWLMVTGGNTVYYPSKSGFNPDRIVGQLRMVGGNDWLRKLDIYNLDKTKRVPKSILNSPSSVMLAFLRGYNACDGLKKNPCTYEFRNFKTNSSTLAMGLWYLIDKTTGQDINLTLEEKEDGRIFYSLNILSTVDNISKEKEVRELAIAAKSQREMARVTGISRTFIRKIQRGGAANQFHYLKKDPLEVKKIINLPNYSGWFYDLTTSSGEFHCGVGRCRVHNSPLRGLEFVTRKITNSVAKIKLGLQKELRLGNMDTRRDWGFAPEYCEAMYLIMQQPKPADFVIATGETHSVRELVQEAFSVAGLDWKKYVVEDKRLHRPLDVSHLCGNPAKARKILGWQPKITFKKLVELMVRADLQRWERYLRGEIFPWDAPNYSSEIDVLSRTVAREGIRPKAGIARLLQRLRTG